MADVTHRVIQTNGIDMHIAEAGTGPLVVLCHGFPESWYSWRYQLEGLAQAGFHVVAPDQRGYGQTDKPEAIDQYSVLHLVGDITGLLDALGEETAVVAGHDWGAPVARHAALLRPDRFRGVIGLSVAYAGRWPMPPERLEVTPALGCASLSPRKSLIEHECGTLTCCWWMKTGVSRGAS
jgi:pimeloyl-ACP methyl ester carboxylesterase